MYWRGVPDPFRLHSSRVNQRSEEHTSELQSLRHLVCRLLLEKKKIKKIPSLKLTNNNKKTLHDGYNKETHHTHVKRRTLDDAHKYENLHMHKYCRHLNVEHIR